MALPDREKMELRYLAKQTRPIWGGVLAARRKGMRTDDPITDRWLAEGLMVEQGDGYVITDKGRAACGGQLPVCRHCGRGF